MIQEIARRTDSGNGHTNLTALFQQRVGQVVEQVSRPFRVEQLIPVFEASSESQLPNAGMIFMARKSPKAICPKGTGAHSSVNHELGQIEHRTGVNQGRRIRKSWWRNKFRNRKK